MPVGHFLRESAFSIHYETYEIYSSMSQKTKGSRSQDRPTKKWVDMQCITFAIKHNKTWRKKNRQDRKDFFPKMCSIFMTGLLKNPIILEESRNWMINTAASVVVSIEWKKRLDHIRVSWELGPHTDFFPCRPRWHFMMNFAWKRLVGISQNIGNNAS